MAKVEDTVAVEAFAGILGLLLLYILAPLLITGTVLYIVFHFISKLW